MERKREVCDKMTRYRIFASTFLLVFFAELGDKSQIASFSLATKDGKTVSVIIGAALALACTSVIAVFLGYKLSQYLSERVVKIGSGILFIATGVYLLARTLVNAW